MYRFHRFLVGLILLTTGILSAGDIHRAEMPVVIYENGFTPIGAYYWAGGGAGLANPDNAEALFYNPAWQTKANYTFLIGGLHHFEKRFILFSDLDVKLDSQWLLPSYLLMARRFKFGSLFWGFQRIYNFKK